MKLKMIPMNGERRADWKPGMIRREDGSSLHYYVCPCGCGQMYSASHTVMNGSSVEAGNLTLSPSLWHNGQGQCGWHGWLQDGYFTPAWHPLQPGSG